MIPEAAVRRLPHAIHDLLPRWAAKPRPAWEETLEKVFTFIENNWDILLFTFCSFCAGLSTGTPYFIAFLIGIVVHLCNELEGSAVDRKAIQLQAPGVLGLTLFPCALILANTLCPTVNVVCTGLEIACGGLAGMGGAFMQWR